MTKYYDCISGREFASEEEAFEFLVDDYDDFDLLDDLTRDEMSLMITELRLSGSDLIDRMIREVVSRRFEYRIYSEEDEELENEE